MAKKSKVDVGKGFKRIYFVIAAIWFIFIMVFTAAERSECIPAEGWVMPLFCKDTTDAEAFMYSLLLWAGSTIPAYYFFRGIHLFGNYRQRCVSNIVIFSKCMSD